ncbi:MAG: lipopolysaccharide biosynthesis protein [Terriglobia bacterium]
MVRSFVSQWVGLAVTGVVSVILTPILVHHLGALYYGMWVLVTSLLDYYGLLDLGIRYTLQRFVSRYHGVNDRKGLNETLATATLGMAAIGALLCAASFLLAAILPHFFNVTGASRSIFQELVVLEGLSVAVVFPARVLGAYVCGLQRFDLYNVGVVVTGVLRAVFFVVVLDHGFGVLGVVEVTLGIAVLTLVINWWLVRWADRGVSLHWRLARWVRLRELGHFSVYVFLSSIGDQLRFYTDSIVIARFLTVALTTPFDVVTRLIGYYRLAFYPVTGPLTTSMSSLDGQGRHHELRRLFLRSSKFTFLLGLVGGALLLLHGKAVLRLWVGKSFESSYVLLVILIVGYIVTLGQLPSQTILYAQARHRAMAIWTLGEGVGNLVLSVYLATHHALMQWIVGPGLSAAYYGLAGVALGTAIPMIVVRSSLQPWYVLRVTKIPAAEYIKDVVGRPLLACLPFAVVCLAAESPWMGANVVHLAVTVAWEAALFVVLAYLLALDAADRQIAWETLHGLVLVIRGGSVPGAGETAGANATVLSEEAEEMLAASKKEIEGDASGL